MDRPQADAIAEAMLAREARADEARRRGRARQAWWLAEKRKVAWLMLAGFAVGAALAQAGGVRFTEGGLWGAFAGAAVGWLWIGWRARRHAP